MIFENKIEPENHHLNSLAKYDKLKLNLKKLLIDSTSHGIPKIFKSEREIYRIIWIIFLLFSTSIGIYLSINNVLEYFEYEVVTKIEVINEPIMQFPKITFYNLNNFNYNYSIDDTLITCYFDFEDCTDKDLEILSKDEYATVYQFNSNGSKKSHLAGSLYSFSVVMFAGLQENFTTNYFTTDEGFQISIHNHTVDPEYVNGFSYSGFKIPIGFMTHIMIDSIYTEKLEYPYSDSYNDFSKMSGFDPLIYNHIIENTNYTYRQKDCIQYCFGKEVMSKCNVTGQFVKIFKLWFKNLTNDIIDCANKIFLLESKKLHQICSNYCPLENKSYTFQVSTSVSNFPNYNSFNSYKSHPKIKSKFPANYNITFEDLRRTMIAFEVYYNDLKYTKITEIQKVKLIDLIANIGGILGLFIGISFLSFIEILEFLLEVIFILTEK